jgi:hypothetical protein
MHRVTRELAHQECGWKHSGGHGVVALDHEGTATSALTNSAFSWKFAGQYSPKYGRWYSAFSEVVGC